MMNKITIRKIGFFVFFISSFLWVAAQNEDSLGIYADDNLEWESPISKGMLPTDSILKYNLETHSEVYPKSFKDSLSSRYKDKEFQYNSSIEEESFFSKLKRKFIELLSKILGGIEVDKIGGIPSILWKVIFLIVGGGFLYLIISYLIKKEAFGLFAKKNQRIEILHEDLPENIHEINFPESISKFENLGDYRMALRYQYLYILKKLNDKKLIHWNPEKTNKDYVRELKQEHLQKDFSYLSFVFDYVWYGEFSIDKESYTRYKSQYQSFKF